MVHKLTFTQINEKDATKKIKHWIIFNSNVIVVPIIKNRTVDIADRNNYSSISLAKIMAKVLDSLLKDILIKHISENTESIERTAYFKLV